MLLFVKWKIINTLKLIIFEQQIYYVINYNLHLIHIDSSTLCTVECRYFNYIYRNIYSECITLAIHVGPCTAAVHHLEVMLRYT